MSAGWFWEPGTKDGTSFLGAKAAIWAAEKTASQIELCRYIRSPLPPHPTWWSPYGSAITWQMDILPPSKLWRPSRYWRHGQNSQSRRWRPRAVWADDETTFNQSPTWGIAQELELYLSCEQLKTWDYHHKKDECVHLLKFKLPVKPTFYAI